MTSKSQRLFQAALGNMMAGFAIFNPFLAHAHGGHSKDPYHQHQIKVTDAQGKAVGPAAGISPGLVLTPAGPH